MPRYGPRAMATALSVACASLYAATVAFWIIGASPSPTPGWGTSGIQVILELPTLAFVTIGAIVALRQPSNRIGLVCLGIGFFLVLGGAAGAYGSYGRLNGSASLPGADFFTWLEDWTWLPAVGGEGTFLLLLFPNGRLPSPRWRIVGYACATVIFLVTLSEAFRPGALPNAPEVANPFAVQVAQHMPGRLPGGANVLFAPCFIAAASSLTMRFRRAQARERLQVKWFTYAAAVLALLFAVAVAGNVLSGVLDTGRPLMLQVIEDAVSASTVGLPLAIGIAVLRRNLYEIDVVINRTLVYGGLTAFLAVAYLCLVLLLQLVLSPLTSQSDLAVAGSTLAVATLARPARVRIQAAVDRRFYRRKYDAQRTVERFGARIRDEFDPDAVKAALPRVVVETMQPAHVSLWLRKVT